jgi:hypothetical protein
VPAYLAYVEGAFPGSQRVLSDHLESWQADLLVMGRRHHSLGLIEDIEDIGEHYSRSCREGTVQHSDCTLGRRIHNGKNVGVRSATPPQFTTVNGFRRYDRANSLSQLGDFVLDARGDLTILALQLAQFQEFARGFGWIAGYITVDRFDVLLDIPKLLCEEDSQSFAGVFVHIL